MVKSLSNVIRDPSTGNISLQAWKLHLDKLYPKQKTQIITKSLEYITSIDQTDEDKIEIARLNYLEGGECSAIFKTYWLKIVQREWKRIYKIRCQVKRERNTPKSITYYQRHGKWPPQINYLPSLKDMRI